MAKKKRNNRPTLKVVKSLKAPQLSPLAELQQKHNELAKAFEKYAQHSNAQKQILQEKCESLKGQLLSEDNRMKAIIFFSDRARCEVESLKVASTYDEEKYKESLANLLSNKLGISEFNKPVGRITVTRYNEDCSSE